ncbi:hypothetical protein FBBAL38_08595 [Flavobacteria bacterium BAL38]|nr:hypothetical protein FBBAL38_08595 [Flavobacteria bacterium BAL38]
MHNYEKTQKFNFQISVPKIFSESVYFGNNSFWDLDDVF